MKTIRLKEIKLQNGGARIKAHVNTQLPWRYVNICVPENAEEKEQIQAAGSIRYPEGKDWN